MIVIAKETEGRLLQELKKCKVEHPSQRCFYMAFSKSDVPRKKLLEEFLLCLQEIPNSYMAQVFICNDLDVFILFQGFMQRHFQAFLVDLAQRLGADDLTELGLVFEIGLGNHWSKLEVMCKDKIDVLKRREAIITEEQKRENAGQLAFKTLSTIDQTLITNISQRRKQRREFLIMIADDDQLSRTLAGNVLRQDYNLVFANNGQNALIEFVNNAPDVLFLDIGMPDMNGHEVLENLFQIDPNAYIIMFSGRKDQGNIMRALDAGAQGFLGKPFTRAELYQHVEKSPFIQGKKTKGAHSRQVNS